MIFEWIKSHPGRVFAIVYTLICVVVALTPRRYQDTKWFGGLLWFMHRASVLAHADQHGTLQWPIIAKAILFGIDPSLQPATDTVQNPRP